MFLIPFYPFFLAYFITRTKLFDAEQFAQAAHRDKLTAIGVLAASINHEVKNPLFIIKGLAETWLERKRAGIFESDKQGLEKGEEVLQRSMEQADRAMDIIRRLSLFAKAGIDSEIKFESVKIAQVIEDILPLVRYELAAHQIALTREIPPDLPDVCADRRYLEEILFNLVVNAIQAVKETGKPGEIKVTAERTPLKPGFEKEKPGFLEGDGKTAFTKPVCPSESCGRVLVRVKDTGPGIPEDKLKDVFRPFYTTKSEGTGLGLYVVKQLVEKNGGRVQVHSRPGVGTGFTIILPVQCPGKAI